MPLTRTFSDERGNGPFHSLGALPKRKPAPVFHLHDDDHVPFPPPTCTPARPPLSRGVSASVLLSNGKPLKSSLKTSPSTPTIAIPPEAQHLHLRARSEPATPAKNVHFPEKDHALATVRVFRRSARPAALSNANGDETETEGEDIPSSFPFPPTPPILHYEIDPTKSSPLPCKLSSPPYVVLEPLHLSPSSSTATLSLTGSVLVANLAFEKSVAVRFTLDDWHTVSEVGAHYADSLSALPSHMLPSSSVSTTSLPRARGWDRFTFTIRLDDYIHSLSSRTLWLASRYRINSTYPAPGSTQHGPGGEWWDNNCGSNYRVAFRPAVTAPGKPRRETISESIFPERAPPQPPTICKEHALAHAVPSVSNKPPLSETSLPPRTGKLSLSNYAPPTVATTSSVPFPSAHPPRNLSVSSITNSDLLASATSRAPSQSDEDSLSPASSALSTPSVSPTMAPRVIINGHPATSVQPRRVYDEDVISSKPGHIVDWDWSPSLDKLRNDMEGLSRQRADPGSVPDLDPPERQRNHATPQGCKALSNTNASSKSLYDAFVTQWCFAQGPSPSRGYGDGGIMA